MNNHQDWGYENPSQRLLPPQPVLKTEQKIISTLALLTLGYYALNFFDIRPSTFRHPSFDWAVWVVPNRAVLSIERFLLRIGRIPPGAPLFKAEDFGNKSAKISALQRIVGNTAIPLKNVMQRARSYSLGGTERLKVAQPPGLANYGFQCYQNSILQGLASLPAFNEYVQRTTQIYNEVDQRNPTNYALAYYLEALNSFSDNRACLDATRVLELKPMDPGEQHDAQEYFSGLLDEIEKETGRFLKRFMVRPGLENVRKRKFDDFVRTADRDRRSAIPEPIPTTPDGHAHHTALEPDMREKSKVFATTTTEGRIQLPSSSTFRSPLDGMLAQSVTCQTCGFTEGLTFTQCNCLTVHLTNDEDVSMEQLISESTAPEEVEDVECTNCTKIAQEQIDLARRHETTDGDAASSTSKARIKPLRRIKSKRQMVGRLSRDLVIHVNRSVFREWGEEKRSANVQIPYLLKFEPDWCASLDYEDETSEVYELKCVILHLGRRHNAGHYIAYARRDKDWYRFDDDIVYEVDIAERLNSTYVQSNVFMAFYEAREYSLPSGWTSPSENSRRSIDSTSTPELYQDTSSYSEALGFSQSPHTPPIGASEQIEGPANSSRSPKDVTQGADTRATHAVSTAENCETKFQDMQPLTPLSGNGSAKQGVSKTERINASPRARQIDGMLTPEPSPKLSNASPAQPVPIDKEATISSSPETKFADDTRGMSSSVSSSESSDTCLETQDIFTPSPGPISTMRTSQPPASTQHDDAHGLSRFGEDVTRMPKAGVAGR